jgi:hypothetical protein
VGSRTLTAAYSGATEFESSSASTAHLVEAPAQTTTTSITADDPDPSAVGQAVTVRFGGASCSATVAQGACDLILLTGGSQTLTAVYAGSESFAGSTDTEPHAVGVPSLSLRRQPSPTAHPGAPFGHQPELQLLNADGKPRERSGVTVTASLVPDSGSLTGEVAEATDDRGRVKFHDLGIDAPPGAYTIRFSADGFTPVTSNPIELR